MIYFFSPLNFVLFHAVHIHALLHSKMKGCHLWLICIVKELLDFKMAPGLALARTNTNISHTPWSYQNELCLGCCFLLLVSFPFLKIPSFCMCFSYDKWYCLKIGFAWKVFCSRLNPWTLGVMYCRWVMYAPCPLYPFIH